MENTDNFNFREGYIRAVTDHSTWEELDSSENKYLLKWIEQKAELSDLENEQLVNNAYEEQKALSDIQQTQKHKGAYYGSSTNNLNRDKFSNIDNHWHSVKIDNFIDLCGARSQRRPACTSRQLVNRNLRQE